MPQIVKQDRETACKTEPPRLLKTKTVRCFRDGVQKACHKARWSFSISVLYRLNKYCPKIIDIGKRRAGYYLIPDLCEKAVAVVAAQVFFGVNIGARRFLKGFGADNRARHLGRAINAVRITGDRMNSLRALQCNRQ